MKRVFYLVAVALVLAAIVASGTFVLAQGRQGQRAMVGQGGGPGPGPMAMLQQLNLTDDQKTRIQSIGEQHRQATQDQAQKLRDLQQQLKNAIFADAGPGDTGDLPQQISALESQMQADRVAIEKQIAAVLTADQRKQVRDMPGPGFGLMMGRGRGRGMGRGMGHGPGW